jgi:Integrase core domain
MVIGAMTYDHPIGDDAARSRGHEAARQPVGPLGPADNDAVVRSLRFLQPANSRTWDFPRGAIRTNAFDGNALICDASSYLREISPAPENLINRDFQATAPNEKWLTDITEFQIPAGKVYLSPIIDCFDGLAISWSIGAHPDAELVNTMRDAAIETVADGEARPIGHSDSGAHYRWPDWLSRIGEATLIRSVSRKGCSPDNAACEGWSAERDLR